VFAYDSSTDHERAVTGGGGGPGTQVALFLWGPEKGRSKVGPQRFPRSRSVSYTRPGYGF